MSHNKADFGCETGARKKNAKTNEVLDKCKFIKSDMFQNIEEKYDVIISNPPYIKSKIIKTLIFYRRNNIG